jgi:hypothetical protein
MKKRTNPSSSKKPDRPTFTTTIPGDKTSRGATTSPSTLRRSRRVLTTTATSTESSPPASASKSPNEHQELDLPADPLLGLAPPPVLPSLVEAAVRGGGPLQARPPHFSLDSAGQVSSSGYTVQLCILYYILPCEDTRLSAPAAPVGWPPADTAPSCWLSSRSNPYQATPSPGRASWRAPSPPSSASAWRASPTSAWWRTGCGRRPWPQPL